MVTVEMHMHQMYAFTKITIMSVFNSFHNIFLKGYPFQIGYSEINCINGNSTLPSFTLYLVAATDKERSEWIKAIRKGENSFMFPKT